MFEFFVLDWHSPTHLLGSGLIFLVIASILDVNKALVVSWLLGIGWEFIDEYCAGIWIFDPRGGDWMDIIMDGCGVLLGIIILHFLSRKYWSAL